MDKNKVHSPDNRLLNILTLVLLAGVVTVIVMALVIYFRPNNALNPFPPPTIPVAVVLPTATATVPPSETPYTPDAEANNLAATQTVATIPTQTSTPTIVRTQWDATSVYAMPITPSAMTATSDYSSLYEYQIQAEPAAISADLFDSSRSNCAWTGVAGQVHDMQGSPVTGILVVFGGSLEYRVQNQTTITGTARNYGISGFEFTLGDHLIASEQTAYIQLVDQSYVPLSPKIYFDTFDDCEKNLIIINFKKVR